jgi:hypothetical protein
MPETQFIPIHTSADTDYRLILPKHFSDLVPWLSAELRTWILLIAPGRHRLLSDVQVEGDIQLESIRELILKGKTDFVAQPHQAESSGRAAIVATLFPASVALHKQSWRISLPRELKVFAPADCDLNSFSVLFSLDGYLEIWYTDVLRKAVFNRPNE